MNSISTMPPAAMSDPNVVRALLQRDGRRMSATSVATLTAARGRVSTSRMIFSEFSGEILGGRDTRAQGRAHVFPFPGRAFLISAKDRSGKQPAPARPRTQPHSHFVRLRSWPDVVKALISLWVKRAK